MYNPYDPTQKGSDYYYDPIPSPPPPPSRQMPQKHKKSWISIVLISFIVILALLVASLAGIDSFVYYQSNIRSTDYTATDILADFGKDGCPCGYGTTYGISILDWSNGNYPVSTQSTSSTSWLDPAQTDGSASIGLWVYSSAADVQSAYTQVGTDERSPVTTWPEYMKPTEYLHGRCLLLITGYSSTIAPWEGYQNALDKYCV